MFNLTNAIDNLAEDYDVSFEIVEAIAFDLLSSDFTFIDWDDVIDSVKALADCRGHKYKGRPKGYTCPPVTKQRY